MFMRAFLGFVLLLVALVIAASLRPSEFRIARSAVMHAPPATVFPNVTDFHQWRAWSPWERMVGGRFEEGLANTKTVVESAPGQ